MQYDISLLITKGELYYDMMKYSDSAYLMLKNDSHAHMGSYSVV